MGRESRARVLQSASAAKPVKLEEAEYYKLTRLIRDVGAAEQQAALIVQTAAQRRDAFYHVLAKKYPLPAHPERLDWNDDTLSIVVMEAKT